MPSIINSDNFSEASNWQFCPKKATLEVDISIGLLRAMPRKRTPDDTGGVVASGTSILHRFAPSNAIVRAFYVPLTQYSTVPKLIILQKNLKSTKFQFEACTTMLEYVCMYDYYTKK